MEPRYRLEQVPLAQRIRTALIAVGCFGSAAGLVASYQAVSGLLRDNWIYPVVLAALGVICAVLAVMDDAWPERRYPAREMGRSPPDDENDPASSVQH